MKRVSSLTDDELVICFQYLDTKKQKTMLLEHLGEDYIVKIYNSAADFRDVIKLICNYLSLRDFLNVKRCSKVFNNNLKLTEHFDLATINHMYADENIINHETHVWKNNNNGFIPSELKEACETYFFVFLERLFVFIRCLHFLKQPDEMFSHTDLSEFNKKRHRRVTRKWIDVNRYMYVHFPSGIICTYGSKSPKGHIFEEDLSRMISGNQDALVAFKTCWSKKEKDLSNNLRLILRCY